MPFLRQRLPYIPTFDLRRHRHCKYQKDGANAWPRSILAEMFNGGRGGSMHIDPIGVNRRSGTAASVLLLTLGMLEIG